MSVPISSVRDSRSLAVRVIEILQREETNFIESLKPIGTESTSLFSGGSAGNSGTVIGSAPQGNFLMDSDAHLLGAISYDPEIISIDDGKINIAKSTGRYKPRLILISESPTNPDVLDNIQNAEHAGQQLSLQIGSDQITLTHDTSGTGIGPLNIRCPLGVDFVAAPQQNISMVFDAIANQWAFADSAAFSSGGGGGGSQTPWLTDIDAASNLLTALGGLRFSETFGAGTPLANNIFTNTLNNWLVFQTRAADKHVFMTGDDIALDRIAQFTKNDFDFSLTGVTAVTTLGQLIVKDRSEFAVQMRLLSVTPSSFTNFNLTTLVVGANNFGDLGEIAIPWNNLNVEQIRLRAGEVINDIPSLTNLGGDMILNVAIGNKLKFFDMGATFVDFSKIITDFDIAGLSVQRMSALEVADISNFFGNMFLSTISGPPFNDFRITNQIPGALDGGDLGTPTVPWNNLNVEQIRLQSGQLISNIAMMTQQGGELLFNVPIGTPENSVVFLRNALVIMRYSTTLFEVLAQTTNIGTSTTNDLGIIARLTLSLVPKFTEQISLGGSSNTFLNVWATVLNFGVGGGTVDRILGNTGGIEYRANVGRTHEWFVSGGVNSFFFNGSKLDLNNLPIEDTGDIKIDSARLRAFGSTEIGIYVTNSTTDVGNAGTLNIPFRIGGESTNAQADADFGNSNGNIGVYGRSGSSPFLCVRTNNVWRGLIFNLAL